MHVSDHEKLELIALARQKYSSIMSRTNKQNATWSWLVDVRVFHATVSWKLACLVGRESVSVLSAQEPHMVYICSYTP